MEMFNWIFEEFVTALGYQNILEKFINQLYLDELRNRYFDNNISIALMTLNYLKEFSDDGLISFHTDYISPP
jgi:hypothetical protein